MVEVTSNPLLNDEIHYFGIASMSHGLSDFYSTLNVKFIILALHLCLRGLGDYYSTLNGEIHYFGIASTPPWLK